MAFSVDDHFSSRIVEYKSWSDGGKIVMFTSSRRAFYLLNRPDFADFVNYFSFRPRGFVQAIGGRRSNPRSERNPIIHGMSKVLLAAKVTFRCLHGRVTEQKLNLLQFSAARVTQLRTCPPQIMGCNMLQPRAFATLSYHAPHQILRDTFPPYFPAPGDGTKYPSFLDSSSCYPPIHCVFHPLRNRDSANSSAFADQVHDGPMILTGLDLVSLQADELGSTEAAAQEHRQHGVVSLS